MKNENIETEKRSLIDKFVDLLTRLSEPMGKFAALPAVASLQDAFATTLVWIILGSIFLIVYAACNGQIGFTIFPSLAKYSEQLYLGCTIGMHFITLYVIVCIAISYGKRLKCNEMSTTLIALAVFFALNCDSFAEGLNVGIFAATNLFTGIFGTLISVKAYSWFVKKNLTIKLPEQVPANVANAFISLIPCLVIFPIAWFIRSIAGINLSEIISTVVTPIATIGDSIWSFTADRFLSSCFWSVGIHYDNLMNSILGPFQTMWMNENAAAAAAGTALTDLPHIWIGSIHNWATKWCYGWPLWIMLLRSKAPGLRQFAITIFVPMIFCIIEPLWFGVPVVLNPIMMLGLIVNWTIGCGLITYTLFALKLCNRVAFVAPWATPGLLQGWIATGGDWRVFLICGIEFIVGYILWYPFFKTYERQLLKKAEEKQETEIKVQNA